MAGEAGDSDKATRPISSLKSSFVGQDTHYSTVGFSALYNGVIPRKSQSTLSSVARGQAR